MILSWTFFLPSIGWAELVGHKLEGPRMALPTKKEKKKAVGKRGKKRSHNNGAVSPGSGLSQVSCDLKKSKGFEV